MNPIMTMNELIGAVGGLIFVIGLLLGGAGRFLLSQFRSELDMRFAGLEAARQHATEQWATRFEALDSRSQDSERRLMQLLIDLPLQYRRNEDAIRQDTSIIYRLDALNLKVEERLEALTQKIEDQRPRGFLSWLSRPWR